MFHNKSVYSTSLDRGTASNAYWLDPDCGICRTICHPRDTDYQRIVTFLCVFLLLTELKFYENNFRY